MNLSAKLISQAVSPAKILNVALVGTFSGNLKFLEVLLVDSSTCRTCRFAETGDSTGTREQSRSLVTLAEAASPS